MKIIGIGTVNVNIQRVEKILKQNKSMFLKKIFTNKEISLIQHFNSNISSTDFPGSSTIFKNNSIVFLGSFNGL
jgi:phosphopantetheinyl transferase (holo-ACP synthase)